MGRMTREELKEIFEYLNSRRTQELLSFMRGQIVGLQLAVGRPDLLGDGYQPTLQEAGFDDDEYHILEDQAPELFERLTKAFHAGFDHSVKVARAKTPNSE